MRVCDPPLPPIILPIVAIASPPFAHGLAAASDPPSPQGHHLPAKLNVVPVRSTLPVTLIWRIQLVGVIVTVLAQGVKLVYCLRI